MNQPSAKVAVIGGGVAGATIALRFSELGIDTTVIEQGDTLVNGPPFCHLHAGGNFYREISDEQCLTLLQQAIETAKVFPLAINARATLVALPKTEKTEPLDLLPRLSKLRERYRQLVNDDASNKVLGEPDEYFELYSQAQLQALANSPLPTKITKRSDWLIAFAKHVDMSKLKFPLVLVQEYGWSAFRIAAIAELAQQNLANCHIKLASKVTGISPRVAPDGWQLTIENQHTKATEQLDFDYVINACGFKSGEIDDLININRQRMVEFKAAYVAHWPQCQGLWPEVLFYGERGTPQGMAQLTPYHNGYFQLHGMTKEITLFEQGLVASNTNSAQPKLPQIFLDKINHQWPAATVQSRTLGAIKHISQFIPEFSSAQVYGKPMFGAQQIPGEDPDLRAMSASFSHKRYARAEIVKASSALNAADAILRDLLNCGLVDVNQLGEGLDKHYFPVTQACLEQQVTELALAYAKARGYPAELAVNNQEIHQP